MVKNIDTSRLFESFRRFQNEQEEEDIEFGQYQQRTYEADYLLMITREMGNKVGELVSEIRSIQNVTVVSQKQSIEENDKFVKGIYGIKFVLEGTENVHEYMEKILQPSLNEIRGVKVIGQKGFRKKVK